MQNKTAPLLLITGALGSIIAVTLSLFFNVSPDVKTLEFEFLRLTYFLQEILLTTAFLVFAFSYMNYGFQKMKTAAVLMLSAGILSSIYLVSLQLIYFVPVEYRSSERISLELLWVLTNIMLIVFSVQLLKKNKNRKALGWCLFLIATVYLLQSVPALYKQVALFFRSEGSESEYILRKVKVVLYLIGLCSPIGFLLMSKRTEELAFDPAEKNDFIRKEFIAENDLLDASTEVNEAVSREIKTDSNSILWWMITYTLAGIPVVGTGLMIYWSVAKSQVKRGNWAAANILITMVSTLIAAIIVMNNSPAAFNGTITGIIVIAMVLFVGVVPVICLTYNNRNQENIPLEKYTYTPTAGKWIGYLLLMVIPVVNVICLIVFSTNKDDAYIRNWSRAMLLMLPITLINYFLSENLLKAAIHFL